MSSRPGAGGFLLTTLLGSFALVLLLGWLVGSEAEQPPPPDPTSASTSPPPPPDPTSASIRLVVGAGQLGVGKEPIQPFRNVVVVVRASGELCVTTPAGSWRPAGESWQTDRTDHTTTYCRALGGDELTRPLEIGLVR